MTVIPFGDYRPDISDLNALYTDQLQNVVARGDGYGPFLSFQAFTQTLPSQCYGAFFAVKTDGSVAIFAATATDLYILNNTTLAWSLVSQSGSYTGCQSGQLWQFVQFNNYVIALQPNDPPQYYDITSSTAFADLPGSPPYAAYVAIVNRFVLLGGLASNPFRIQWSGLDDPTNWTSGVNSSDYQDLPDGGVVRGVAGGDLGYIFQDNAIRNFVFAPGSDVVFTIDRIVKDMGILAPYSLISAGPDIFFYSQKGFQRLNPSLSSQPIPIGAERVDRTLADAFDPSSLQYFQAAQFPNANTVLFAFKSIANNAQCFDSVLAYNVTLDKWTPLSINGQFLYSFERPGITLEGLDAIAPNDSLDALPVSLDSYSNATLPQIGMFDTTAALGFFNGTPLEAVLQTGEQTQVDQRIFVQGFYPRSDAPTIYGNIAKRENFNETPAYTTENAMNARGFIPARADTRAARGRIRIPAGTLWTYAQGVDPLIVPRGRR